MESRASCSRIEVPPDPRDLPGEFPFCRTIEVRFGDTDAMGHVNNAVYLTYCEAARVSYFEAATGRSFLDVGDHDGAEGAFTPDHAANDAADEAVRRGAGVEGGVGPRHRWSFILAEARVTFRQPAYFGEVLAIETRTCRIGRSSMTMEYRITAPESRLAPARLIAVCDSTQVGYDYAHHHAVALPDDLVAMLERFEGRPLREQ